MGNFTSVAAETTPTLTSQTPLRRSVYKFAAMNVLLIGLVAALGFREKKMLQRLAEM